jgi:hypothetical protein
MPVRFFTIPSFIFRSVLGKELRQMTCLFTKRQCNNCDLKVQCVYSWLFESPIKKDNEILKGRNRAPHPFVLSNEPIERGIPAKNVVLNITLMGKAIKQFPYIYYAFRKGGENGILKSRIPYRIKSVMTDAKEILIDDEQISTKDIKAERFLIQDNAAEKDSKPNLIKIGFYSPVRMKVDKKYSDSFDYLDLIGSMHRRISTLAYFYGEYSKGSEDYLSKMEKKKMVKNYKWQEYTRYSSAQKQTMKIGGVAGDLTVEGIFTKVEKILLNAMELFSVGKNTSMGMGRVKVTKEEE